MQDIDPLEYGEADRREVDPPVEVEAAAYNQNNHSLKTGSELVTVHCLACWLRSLEMNESAGVLSFALRTHVTSTVRSHSANSASRRSADHDHMRPVPAFPF
jgi:hypothetical protein